MSEIGSTIPINHREQGKTWDDTCLICKILTISASWGCGNRGCGDWGSPKIHDEIERLLASNPILTNEI